MSRGRPRAGHRPCRRRGHAQASGLLGRGLHLRVRRGCRPSEREDGVHQARGGFVGAPVELQSPLRREEAHGEPHVAP
eukprot:10471242-Alexandrium_andersonii.AAC.1